MHSTTTLIGNANSTAARGGPTPYLRYSFDLLAALPPPGRRPGWRQTPQTGVLIAFAGRQSLPPKESPKGVCLRRMTPLNCFDGVKYSQGLTVWLHSVDLVWCIVLHCIELHTFAANTLLSMLILANHVVYSQDSQVTCKCWANCHSKCACQVTACKGRT